jgi:hypothetical protein
MKDQHQYMSLVSMLMYGAKRTYMEILTTTVMLSTKYMKASEGDYLRAMKVAQYVVGCGEEHRLVLAPNSLQLIASADASYGEHTDGKSHTGGVIGFESDTSCWFTAISTKQPVVAKSSCEAELIAVNHVGDYVEWGVQLMGELGYPQRSVTIEQDNTCSMAILKQGTGSFKRAKHIKVRFFWLKDLIDAGIVLLKYVASAFLVADLMTKPVTGQKFRVLRKRLLGWGD